MSQCHDRHRMGMTQLSIAVSSNRCVASRRRWFLAITISAVFHLAMGWSLFEAGVHWPMARCEPVDTRVSPPIDAVTVDLSEPAAQTAEPPGPSAPPVKVARPAIPQAHGSTTGTSIASTGFSSVRRATASVLMGMPASEGTTRDTSHAAIEPRPNATLAPALPGIEVPRNARKVVYVVDRSASMGPGGALDRAISAVGESIAALPSEARFQIVFYNRRPELLPAQQGLWLWQASAQAKATAIESLHHWRAEGGTDHVNAIRAAFTLRPDVIYWLTDGADLTTTEIDSITRSNKWKVAINTMGMCPGNRADTEPLQRLSLANRGAFRQLSSTGD